MLDAIRPFFDHSRHTLSVDGLDAPLDVLAFEGTEALSQTFRYTIEFTSSAQDIPADGVLRKAASFSLRAAPSTVRVRGFTPPEIAPLRTLHGVITAFKRLSASRDEARYEVTLEPRLALLDKGCQYRIYQNQSVPEIVEAILRRHGLLGQDFLVDLGKTYAQHEQMLQYGETDLLYLQRICAERGIWYSFSMDARLRIDVVEFHDSPLHYHRDISLPLRPLSGMASVGQDAVWDLQASHQVVQQCVSSRAYYSRDAGANLDGQADLTRGATTTYGEAYHYADEHYETLGNAHARGNEEGHAESGYFYAQLAHERYLNDQTRLFGVSSSAALAPGQVLRIEGGAPDAFAEGALIVKLHSKAARDRSFEVHFEAIPDSDTIAFRPPVPPKPRIAGTVPACVTSPQQNDPYGHIDNEGRYRVNFRFDRDAWDAGRESLWLRLARPYAGDTHGLHLPLLAGTEVAIAFEQGDPDRPYIAHALHDNLHPDLVTIRNYKRNVLRTPANNKIRLDDTRGQEHIKVSTEYGGKSQLNLGHLVDAQKQKRGEGFEMRTDDWGAIRAGKGLFISADEQVRAGGQALAMQPAESLLKGAVNQMEAWAETAQSHHNPAPDRKSLRRLQADAAQLKAPALLLSAPNGIGAVSPQSILLDSAQALYLQSAGEVNLASEDRLHANSRQAMSFLAQAEGMRLVSGKGPLNLESHADTLSLIAQKDVTVQSVQGHLQITAKQGITLASGGAYIRLTPDGKIEVHGPTALSLKGQHRLTSPTSQDFPLPELPTSVCKDCLKKAQAMAAGFAPREA
ncbi:type VI secretion system Vgr family protein [Pseudomonas citronellolis]|uniref:type VI secretion system Vgr family protein n=1 Tax=Pseudomonas citronellolis TaxID=53408 RepID=UPI0023E3BE61|nr:type VI secretion system Vgr family protein [Pseudomonas citronellolis]MDF3934271.1 type VI secretion system tip protein VgrG [Pseudomonas citronellolis]